MFGRKRLVQKGKMTKLCRERDGWKYERYPFINGCRHYVDFQRVFDNTSRMASRCDAAKELMRYYHEKGDYRKAADYALGYQQANDSVIRERQFDLTRNAQAEYHYQRNKAAEEALVRHGERVRLWSIVGGLLCVIAVQTIVVTYFYRKKQMHETIIGKEKEIGKAKNLIAQKETDLVASSICANPSCARPISFRSV